MASLLTGSARTPVTVRTGFLGAGKTAMLNRILHADHSLNVTVADGTGCRHRRYFSECY